MREHAALSLAGMLLFASQALAAKPVTIYSFPGTEADGADPNSLTEINGILFGTTLFGSTSNNYGAVFSIDPKTKTEKVVYAFQGQDNVGPDGGAPSTAPVGLNGLLYGGTSFGGTGAAGVLYSLDPTTGAETVVHAFKQGPDGANPNSLTLLKGVLYGTTASGGGGEGCAYGCGTIFSYNPRTGVERTIYRFLGGADGAGPTGLVALNGTLYGVTGSNYGTVFQFNPVTRAVTTLHAFQDGTDGSLPSGAPILVGNTLYGMTNYGGLVNGCYMQRGCGTVYQINLTTSAESILYAFQGGEDGSFPNGAMAAKGGLLYGATDNGGSSECIDRLGCGTVFQVNPATGQEAVLYAFKNSGAGQRSNSGASLIGSTTAIFGFTQEDGEKSNPYGSVFTFLP